MCWLAKTRKQRTVMFDNAAPGRAWRTQYGSYICRYTRITTSILLVRGHMRIATLGDLQHQGVGGQHFQSHSFPSALCFTRQIISISLLAIRNPSAKLPACRRQRAPLPQPWASTTRLASYLNKHVSNEPSVCAHEQVFLQKTAPMCSMHRRYVVGRRAGQH